MVFLYFVNADDMLGPMSEEEWHGAVRLLFMQFWVCKRISDLAVCSMSF